MSRAAWFRAGFRWWVAGSVLMLANVAFAADGWVTLPFTPFQLSIASGVSQIFSKATPVYGLRVSALYGTQSKVIGLDAGFFNDTGALTGLGVGFCNVARENAIGAQLGAGCSQVEVNFAGLQAAFVNQVGGRLAGLQLGFGNGAGSGAGAQIGLLNHAGSMRGVQLGLLNWNDNGFLPLFPFINFGF